MPDYTPKLGLTLLAAGGGSSELLVNQNNIILEAISQARVIDRDLSAPPGSPVRGDLYLIAASASGAWSGQSGKLGVYDGTNWVFVTPTEGMSIRIADEDIQLEYDGTAWVAPERVQTLTDGATINWDARLGSTAVVTIAGNRTLAAPSNVVPGRIYNLLVIQDGTGGRTLTWNANFRFPDGTAPRLSTQPSSIDRFQFIARSSSELQLIAVQVDKPETWPTTETWTGEYKDGSKLYVKAIDFGALPNNTAKSVAHGVTGIDLSYRKAPRAEIVQSILGFIVLPIPMVSQALLITDMTIDGVNVSIATNYDGTAASAFVRLFYCKT